jgi:hypothetical protein
MESPCVYLELIDRLRPSIFARYTVSGFFLRDNPTSYFLAGKNQSAVFLRRKPAHAALHAPIPVHIQGAHPARMTSKFR